MNALNSDQVYIEYGEFSLIWKIAITLARISMYQSDYFLFTSLQTFLHGGPIRKCLRFLRTVEMCFFRLHLIDDKHKPKLEFWMFCRNFDHFLLAKNSKFVNSNSESSVKLGWKTHIHSYASFFRKLNFWLKRKVWKSVLQRAKKNMRPYFTQSSIYSS